MKYPCLPLESVIWNASDPINAQSCISMTSIIILEPFNFSHSFLWSLFIVSKIINSPNSLKTISPKWMFQPKVDHFFLLLKSPKVKNKRKRRRIYDFKWRFYLNCSFVSVLLSFQSQFFLLKKNVLKVGRKLFSLFFLSKIIVFYSNYKDGFWGGR